MIFTTTKNRNERFNICKSCEWFKEHTTSCGTFLPANMIKGKFKGDLVDVGKKKKVRLCGCNMAQKTKFKSASCPAGKWKAEVDYKSFLKLQKIVNGIKGNTMKREDAEELVREYNQAFGSNKKLNSCGSCLKQIVDEVKASQENK